MLLEYLGLLEEGTTVVLENNTAAIKWTKSERMAQHVDVRYHFVKDEVSEGTLNVFHSRSVQMLADLMTKGLTGERVEFLRKVLCIGRVLPRRESKEEC